MSSLSDEAKRNPALSEHDKWVQWVLAKGRGQWIRPIYPEEHSTFNKDWWKEGIDAWYKKFYEKQI